MLEEKSSIISTHRFEEYATITNKIAVVLALLALVVNPLFIDFGVGDLSSWFTTLFLVLAALSLRIPYPYKSLRVNKILGPIVLLYGIYLIVVFMIHFNQLENVMARDFSRRIEDVVNVEVRINEWDSGEYHANVWIYVEDSYFSDRKALTRVQQVLDVAPEVFNNYEMDEWEISVSVSHRDWMWGFSYQFGTCSEQALCINGNRFPYVWINGNPVRYFRDQWERQATARWTIAELTMLVENNERITNLVSEISQQIELIRTLSPHLDRESGVVELRIDFDETVNHENFEIALNEVLDLFTSANRSGLLISNVIVRVDGEVGSDNKTYRLEYALDVEQEVGFLNLEVNSGDGWIIFEDAAFDDIHELIENVGDALGWLEDRIMNKLGVYSVNAERIRYHRQPHQYGVFTQPRLSVEVVISPEIGVEGFADFVAFAQPLLIDEVNRFHRTPNNNPWEVFLILEDQLVWSIFPPTWSSPRRDRGTLLNLVADFECPFTTSLEYCDVTGLIIADIREMMDEWFYDGE